MNPVIQGTQDTSVKVEKHDIPVVVLTPSERKAMNRRKYKERKKRRKTITEETPNEDDTLISEYTRNWNQMFNVVAQFKEQYNRLPSIRGTHKMEAVIGRWIFLQKLDRKKGSLPSDFATKLESIGI